MTSDDRPGFYSLSRIDLAPILSGCAGLALAEIDRLKDEIKRLETANEWHETTAKTTHEHVSWLTGENGRLWDENSRLNQLLAEQDATALRVKPSRSPKGKRV